MRLRIVMLLAAAALLAALLPAVARAAQLPDRPGPRAGSLARAAAAPHGPATSVGRGGAVATVEYLATKAAVRVLRDGGNAVDAAVVAAGVLTVTEPFSCGIGGGGYLVIYDAARRKVVCVDGRETAPAAMQPDSFWSGGVPLAFAAARYSGLSVGVPATVATWAYLLRTYGTLSLREALAPAIAVAEEGFIVDQTFHDQVAGNDGWFDDVPATAALYLDPDGTPRDVGSVLRNPDLARTLRLIARSGAKAFYRGPIADAILSTVARPPLSPDADHVWRPGLMTAADLRAYAPLLRAPTRVEYRGLDVYGMAPSSAGGSTVGEALNILSGYPLSSASRETVLQRMLESSRYAFADRNAYVADPAFFPVPLAGLLDPAYAAERRALITDVAAVSPVGPGTRPRSRRRSRPCPPRRSGRPRPTSPRATAPARSSRTRSPSSPREAPVWSFPATGSCSTTSSPTSPTTRSRRPTGCRAASARAARSVPPSSSAGARRCSRSARPAAPPSSRPCSSFSSIASTGA